MPIDQAHEQNNELVKGSGGTVGLTDNPSAFRKWMIAGPEQARLLKEFEKKFMSNVHHEEGFCTQKTFHEQAKNLVQAISEMGNPFLDATPELDTRNITDESVVTTVRSVEALGKEQYEAYHESVIKDRSRSIHESIKRNSFHYSDIQPPRTRANRQARYQF